MAAADFTYGYNIPTDERAKEIVAELQAFMVEYRKTPAYKPAGWRDKQPKPAKIDQNKEN